MHALAASQTLAKHGNSYSAHREKPDTAGKGAIRCVPTAKFVAHLPPPRTGVPTWQRAMGGVAPELPPSGAKTGAARLSANGRSSISETPA